MLFSLHSVSVGLRTFQESQLRKGQEHRKPGDHWVSKGNLIIKRKTTNNLTLYSLLYFVFSEIIDIQYKFTEYGHSFPIYKVA